MSSTLRLKRTWNDEGLGWNSFNVEDKYQKKKKKGEKKKKSRGGGVEKVWLTASEKDQAEKERRKCTPVYSPNEDRTRRQNRMKHWAYFCQFL